MIEPYKQPETFPTCDICGKEIAYPQKCNLCAKNVCLKCHAWYDSTACGDCLGSYCIECWELGTECRSEIEKTIKNSNKELNKLEKKWADIVTKNKEKKTNNENLHRL